MITVSQAAARGSFSCSAAEVSVATQREQGFPQRRLRDTDPGSMGGQRAWTELPPGKEAAEREERERASRE